MKTEKPKNCYQCIYRRSVPGSTHSKCVFNWNGSSHFPPKGSEHGINKGWWAFPFDYDPIWILGECKELNDGQEKAKETPPIIKSPKVKLTEDQTAFLNGNCTIINTSDGVDAGDVYMYLPFWYKKTDVDNVFEVLSFDALPSDLKKELNERRNPNDIPSPEPIIPDFDISKTYGPGHTVKYVDNVWVFKPGDYPYPSIYDGIKDVIVTTGIYPGTGNGWKIKKL